MPKISPPDLLKFCKDELHEHVTLGFSKFVGSEGIMYFADNVTIQNYEGNIWNDVRNVHPAPTTITVEQALKIICKKNDFEVLKESDEKRTNDELIEYYCRIASGQLIKLTLDHLIKQDSI